MIKKAIVLSSLILAVCGCVKQPVEPPKPPTEVFRVGTRPGGASVSLSSGKSCVTPCVLEVTSHQGFTVRISKEGYRSASVKVMSKSAGPGGPSHLTPNPVYVVLEPEWTK